MGRRCQEGAASGLHLQPPPPRESHACCNNVATDFIPLPPRLFTLNLLSSGKTDNLTVLNLFKGFSGFLERRGEVNHFFFLSVFGRLRVVKGKENTILAMFQIVI